MFDKKVYMKKWRKDNREHIKEIDKQYRIDNFKHRRKYNDQWRSDNPEYDKQWYLNNEKYYKQYYEDNKEQKKECVKQYRRTNEGKAVHQKSQTKRQTIMANVINTLTSQEWLDILEKYNYVCAYCGEEFTCENLPTKDHIIPISKGGNNTKENIIPACSSCNSKKHNKIIFSKELSI